MTSTRGRRNPDAVQCIGHSLGFDAQHEGIDLSGQLCVLCMPHAIARERNSVSSGPNVLTRTFRGALQPGGDDALDQGLGHVSRADKANRAHFFSLLEPF